MGLPPHQLAGISLRDLFNAIEVKTKTTSELYYQTIWESARFIATSIYDVNTTKKKRIRPKDVITFPWEEQNRVSNKNGITQEQLDAMMRFIAE